MTTSGTVPNGPMTVTCATVLEGKYITVQQLVTAALFDCLELDVEVEQKQR